MRNLKSSPQSYYPCFFFLRGSRRVFDLLKRPTESLVITSYIKFTVGISLWFLWNDNNNNKNNKRGDGGHWAAVESKEVQCAQREKGCSG